MQQHVNRVPEGEWPAEDLEYLGQCPMCGDVRREMLFDDLRDKVAFAAPGAWTMWRCVGCGSGYLDPRPSEASIGRAYSTYYTHAESQGDHGGLFQRRAGLVPRLRQGLRNGFLNEAFGYRLPNALPFGALAMGLMPALKARAEFYIRHLPAPECSGAKLLDVGCGNGVFLKIARSLGYEAWGLEPDPKAAAAANSQGFKVSVGGFPGSGMPEGEFSHITLNHVFEHLHQPVEALAEIHQLLKPGGTVWLSFPNIDSQGLKLFGKDWRGLEPPRHVVLSSFSSLEKTLGNHGFENIRLCRPQAEASFYFLKSSQIMEGMPPFEENMPRAWGKTWDDRAVEADANAAQTPCFGESLTVIATRC